MTCRDSSPRPFYILGAPPSPDITQNPVAVGNEGRPPWAISQLSLQSLSQLFLICLLPLLLDPSIGNGIAPRGRKEAVPWAQPSHCQLPGCSQTGPAGMFPQDCAPQRSPSRGQRPCSSERGTCCWYRQS